MTCWLCGSCAFPAAANAGLMSVRCVRTCDRCSTLKRFRHSSAAAWSGPFDTARIRGDFGSLRSVRMVTYSLCRFLRLISSKPTSVITRSGLICCASCKRCVTIDATISALMPKRRATSSSVEPISIRSTCYSNRNVCVTCLRLNGGNSHCR